MPTTRTKKRTSPLDAFPRRLRERIGADGRAELSHRLAASVGEDVMKKLVAGMPALTTTDPGDAKRLWMDDSPLLRWVDGLGLVHRRVPTSPDIEWRRGPFKRHPTTANHGGNAPNTQHVVARDDGFMQIFTRIEDDSSQLESVAFVGTQVHPLFEKTLLTVSPHVMYQAWHPLHAVGGGGSHSDGAIGVVIMSSRLDGSDWRFEAGNERPVWDSRVGGPFPDSSGHQIDEAPDVKGALTIRQLEAQLVIDADRRYWAFAYIASMSDADGSHLFYASNSLVLFDATVDVFWIRQDKIV
jgi:hypothetical protein